MRLLLGGFVLALASALALTACNSSDQKNSTVGRSAPPQSATPGFADGVRRVTPNELQDLLTRNEAIVIDVRTDSMYQAGHVKGARLIPEAEVASHSVELPKDKLIVTYCS